MKHPKEEKREEIKTTGCPDCKTVWMEEHKSYCPRLRGFPSPSEPKEAPEKVGEQCKNCGHGEEFHVHSYTSAAICLYRVDNNNNKCLCRDFSPTPKDQDGKETTEERIKRQRKEIEDLGITTFGNPNPSPNTEWEKEFESLWKELVDWAGSGFRYKDASLTGEGLRQMKPRFSQLLQKERAKEREKIVEDLKQLVIYVPPDSGISHTYSKHNNKITTLIQKYSPAEGGNKEGGKENKDINQ